MMEDAIAIILLMFAAAAGYVFDLWTNNPMGKVKLLRNGFISRLLKSENTILVNAMINDSRTIKSFVVNPKGAEITIGNYTWIFSNLYLWRKELIRNSKGEWELKEQKEKGFRILERHFSYEEGIPILFVDYETFIPRQMAAEIQKPKEGGVTPLAFGTTVLEYINNLRAKSIADFINDMKNVKQLITIILVIAILGMIAAGYGAYNQAQETKKCTDQVWLVLNATQSYCAPNLFLSNLTPYVPEKQVPSNAINYAGPRTNG